MSFPINLRRTWVVIYSNKSPLAEISKAQEIANYLRSKGNIAILISSTDESLAKNLTVFSNILTIGGPAPNQWVYILNEYTNPKWDLELAREQGEEETWDEFTSSGGLIAKGFIWNDKTYAGRAQLGIIGKGILPALRIRPMVIVNLGGWNFEDSCTMFKAYMENAEVGVYQCTYTPIPDMSACPVDSEYTIEA